jgi:type IV pilus assembly protein PilE
MHTWINRRIFGFTLLEMLIVVALISVLAAVATPLYYEQLRDSQRAAAQSQMLQLASDLERWRGKNFSYQRFQPLTAVNGLNYETDNKTIYIPAGSTAANFRYMIILVDSADRTLSLVPPSLPSSVGLNWTMIARPNSGDLTDTNASEGYLGSASRLVLNSRGLRCMTPGTSSDHIEDTKIETMTISDAQLCGADSQNW